MVFFAFARGYASGVESCFFYLDVRVSRVYDKYGAVRMGSRIRSQLLPAQSVSSICVAFRSG